MDGNIQCKFFNPFAEIAQHESRLPHWQQPGATYFLTYRLADSIPKALMERWLTNREAWQNAHPKPWTLEQALEFERCFGGQIEGYLDALHGACTLRRPETARLVAEVLQHFDGDRYLHHAWVIMPNHVHMLFTLRADRKLENEVKAWKGVSARRINAQLARAGDFWQRDYFDRIIRDTDHFWRCTHYIHSNPEKCHLKEGEFILYEYPPIKDALAQARGGR